MPELESAGSIPLALAAVAILFASATSLGGLVVRPTMTKHWHQCDAILVRLAVGLNLLGVVGVTLGQTGLLAHGRSVWLLAGLSLWCAYSIWSNLRLARSDGQRRATPRPSLIGLLAI